MGVPVRQIEALPASLNGAERAIIVWRNVPLDELAWWKRWLVRAVYFLVEWNTGDGVEFQAICTREELADKFSNRPGWHWLELPVDECLPAETCQYGKYRVPQSDATQRYEQRKLDYVAVPRHALKILEKANAREAERT